MSHTRWDSCTINTYLSAYTQRRRILKKKDTSLKKQTKGVVNLILVVTLFSPFYYLLPLNPCHFGWAKLTRHQFAAASIYSNRNHRCCPFPLSTITPSSTSQNQPVPSPSFQKTTISNNNISRSHRPTP